MEISLLKGYEDGFKRDKLIESWNSLSWTERHSINGEFEMISNNIGDILTLLPIGGPFDPPTLVAEADSDVPMRVETHEIEKAPDGTPQIKTTGRSFETVLEDRVTIKAVTSGVPRVDWQIEAPSAALAAYTVAKNIIVDGIANPLDIIPEILLLDGTSDTGDTVNYPVEPKELYTWMIETLALGRYGFKSILPIPSASQIVLEIYKGTDRRTSVVFSVALDQIEKATYLLSTLGNKNDIIVATTNGMEETNTGNDPATGSAPAGLARKVDYLDISSDVNVDAGADLTALTINKGQVALADRLPTALFSGGIAEAVADGYGSTYFLGDIVKLQGEYGLSQDARIAEFIRTHDTTGIKSYPTFEAYTP